MPGERPVNDQLVEPAGAIWVMTFAVNPLMFEASTRYSVAPAEAVPHERFTCVEDAVVADRLPMTAGTRSGRSASSIARNAISFALNKSSCVSVIWKSPYLSPQARACPV